MAPKIRFPREKVVEAALQVVREYGAESLTVRLVAAKLGASSQPIFTHFPTMEALMKAVTDAAHEEYNHYIEPCFQKKTYQKFFAINYIRFASCEPNLFALLFMQKCPERTLTDYLGAEGHYERIIEFFCENEGLTRSQAEILYRSLWMYLQGMASMQWSGGINYSEKDILDLLVPAYRGMVLSVKIPVDQHVQRMPQNGQFLTKVPDYVSKFMKQNPEEI